MACPYFHPKERIGHPGWNPAPRMPLGDAWSGTCHAPGVGSFEPDEESARTFCNYGYARNRCSRFPAQTECDAVRFSVINGDGLTILYVREKDGAPVEHGEVHEGLSEPILVAQAQAFKECWTELIRSEGKPSTVAHGSAVPVLASGQHNSEASS